MNIHSKNKFNLIKSILLLMIFTSIHLQSQNLKVMTYNLRYDNPNDGENKWDLRKEFLCKQIQFYNPDIFGSQEGKIHQLKYIDSTLSVYGYVGRGRDNTENQGEFSAIFYLRSKFKVLNDGTFWLSETPDKVSIGWDANLERICTYALMENIITNEKFYFFNAHLDHMGEMARFNSAHLLVEKINSINTQNYPVILTGDFNSEPDSKTYDYLSKQLNDTRAISKSIPFGPTGSFNNFEFNKPVNMLIDYIFTSKNNVEANKFAILSDSKNCKYPSDHLPIYVELTLLK